MEKVLTLEQVKSDVRVKAYIEQANAYLDTIGYTDHGLRHSDLVSHIAHNILSHLNFPRRRAELASIAGYLHDIGNVTAREGHEQAGAVIALGILDDLGMDPAEQGQIALAIANYESPVSDINAAVLLADKGDVHRSRVQKDQLAEIQYDIHDRVNYAVTKSFVKVDNDHKQINLTLKIDTEISDIMDYFTIFSSRMITSQKAARFLGCQFGLIINDVSFLGTSRDGKIVGSRGDDNDNDNVETDD